MIAPSSPSTFADVRRRSIQGVAALAVRGGLGKLVTIASTIVLARLLVPADFGAFALLQLPVGWLNLLADAGISAALIQRPVLTAADERTGFLLRVGLAAGLGLLLFLTVDWVGRLYQLAESTQAMLRVLAVGPVISALGTVPSIRLTRALRFDRLALAEMGSLVTGQGTAVYLAWRGAGLGSLVAGSLATVAAGSLLVNLLSPWRPRWRGPISPIRPILRFGLLYQGQGVVHLLKDQALPALGGVALGAAGPALATAQIGYLSWAQDVARWPRLPADYVSRVAFPAFARLQADPAGLNRLLRGTVTAVSLLSFSAVAAGLVLAPGLVGPVFGSQWLPAVPVLLIFLLQTPLDALAAILLPVIYASGRAATGLRLSAAWAALTWLLSLIALAVGDRWPGGLLLALPAAFGLGTVAALLVIARRLPPGISVNWRTTLARSLLLALLVGGIVYGLAPLLPGGMGGR